MNPPPDEKNSASIQPGRVFLVLFLLVVLAGLIFGALVVWGPADGPCKKWFEKAVASFHQITKSSTFVKNIGPGITLTCQGVTLDINNNALAILNDQTVGIGQIIEGVKVIDITSGYVMIEYQGAPRRLALGEKLFIPLLGSGN